MAFRAFYALPAENFSTSGGQHTNAVYGFLSMFSNILAEEQPTHVAVAFDVGRTTFRTEKFPEYKAQREASPPEFKGQVPIIEEVLDTLGVVTLSKEHFEADDIVATLVTEARAEGGFDIVLVSGDRDYIQLVDAKTTLLYPTRGVSTMTRFTPEKVEEKYGLTPVQYPDFAALRGDPSDNLPSVPKVGEKTATKWIVEHGDLESLIAHADDIKGVAGANFRERIDQVRLNRELTQMVTDVELPVGPADLALKPADVAAVAAAFDDLEFGVNLRERVLAAVPTLGEVPAGEEAELAEITVESAPLDQWLSAREGQGLAVYLTGSGAPGMGDVSALAIVDKQRRGIQKEAAELSPAEDEALARWAESADPKFFHDAKAAYHMLKGRGITLGGIAHDTAIAAYLLRPGQRTYELADVYQRHLQRQLDQGGDQLSLLGDSTLIDSAAAILELAAELARQLRGIDSYELYADLELPLVAILAEMENAGIAVDVDVLEDQLNDFRAKVDEVEQHARQLVDEPSLNLSSPKQLQVVLFDKLGLPKTKKTKTGYSTAAGEIEALAEKNPHPFLDALLAHREYQKMKSTIEGLIKAVLDDGRIHTTFKQTVASTGRLSSTDPNLQNIPVRTEAGRKIRSAFTVGKGYECLLTADYSQIEMRVMAHLSGDEGLIEAYRAGEDLHNFVGSRVFDVPIDQVTPELRRRVKAMSYGLVYGLSAYGLSNQLSISAGEAKSIMESYFERFGGVKRYLDEVVEKAREVGYTSTVFGRRRYLPELTSDNRVARENAERAALNAPIQGTAADIIKVAMIRVDRALASFDSRVLLQVHDELVVEVAPGELDEVREIVEREMDSAIELHVPLEVSAGTGANWDEAAH
ncbi:DNA polymerase I [Corynebacterium liangguodongii]|uniref:DNA polymerase I n=1 Tax=Corynebacterium liangguodongii TaxID=2079535 RepID=A0A2S0WH06_9CORY|nr:DNA polymerase I [Corynebacterium liangguodongii]AWB85059.1 DNA polymerase I [Corynebacterium liangguodongii]PWB99107.1 DNA polymerase I [Corynebacterium liangguodongii]